MMLKRIVSGGQTGVDQAALYAAQILGIETGGWADQDWRTEDGCAEELLRSFGLKACSRPGYPARTEANVRDSDATLILSHEDIPTGGTYDTMCCVEAMDKPCFRVRLEPDGVREVYRTKGGSHLSLRAWIALMEIKTLNVAGPRASKCGWIEQVAAEYLIQNL